MVMVAKLIEVDVLEMSDLGDRWVLTGDNVEIVRICFDWAVTLTVGSADSQIEVRIERAIVFADAAGASSHLAPDGVPTDLAPLLQVVRQPLTRLEAFADGHLEIELGRGETLTVGSSDEFEPWEIVGPRGFRIVSVPDGAITVWSPSGT
jgi:hypothetical protein